MQKVVLQLDESKNMTAEKAAELGKIYLKNQFTKKEQLRLLIQIKTHH